MNLIEYFQALAGAGKTYALARQADKLARAGEKVLIVQPTKVLLDETYNKELAPLDAIHPVTIIHGESIEVDENVIVEIVNHLKRARDGDGEILMITHAAFLLVPYWHLAKDWTVIIDEVFQVATSDSINLPETHKLITDHLVHIPYDAKYSLIEPKQDRRAALNRIARNKHNDLIYGLMKDFCKFALDDNYKLFVISDQYVNLLRGDKNRVQITFFAELQPTIFEKFKRTIVCSALMKEQLMYQLWANGGLDWKPVPESWTESLLYSVHENGELMYCYYASQGNWSKQFRDLKLDSGDKVMDLVTAKIVELVGERKCLWMGNNDTDLSLWGNRPNIVRLPNSPHGLNKYKDDYHACVVTSALNGTPAFVSWLKSRGIDADAVRTAMYRSAVYQAWMRTSARKKGAGVNKMLVVMDADTADFMASLFPGMKTTGVPGLGLAGPKKTGRPRKYANGIDRKSAYRKEQMSLLIDELLGINGSDLLPVGHGMGFKTPYFKSMMTQEICPVSSPRNEINLPVFESKDSAKPFTHIEIEDGNTMIEFLRDCAKKERHLTKGEGLLTSASFFAAADDSDTWRGLADIDYIYGIWLDCDGGDLSPEEFASMFPYLRMAIYSTYTSTPEVMKWRAFIPTTHLMRHNVHDCVIRQILEVVNHRGYWSDQQLKANSKIKSRKRHGFDPSKFTPSSLFFLPNYHPDGPKPYFKDFDDLFRAALDVPTWVERSILDIAPEPVLEALPDPDLEGRTEGMKALVIAMRKIREGNKGVNETKVAQATARWNSTRRGEGNKAFYKYACDLQDAGMEDHDIANLLRTEYRNSGSNSEDRKKQIKSIMLTLSCRGSTQQRHGNFRF